MVRKVRIGWTLVIKRKRVWVDGVFEIPDGIESKDIEDYLIDKLGRPNRRVCRFKVLNRMERVTE